MAFSRPAPQDASQAEMQAGTEAAVRTVSPLRVAQAIAALGEAAGAVSTHAAVTSGVHGISAFAATILDDADAATVRGTIGLGTISTQSAASVSITGGTVTGITDLAVADGGTGASTVGAARTNLSVTPAVLPWFKDSTICYGPAGGVAGTYAQSNGVLIAYPQFFPTCTVVSLRLIVTSAGASGSVFRVGLASPHTDNRPGVLLHDWGTVAGDSTGAKTITFGSSVSLTNGMYYVLVLKDGASGTATISAAASSYYDGSLGSYYVSATPQIHPICWWYLSSQSGSLSSNYSASAWLPQVSTATPRIAFFQS